jgi:hypothetical protein
MTPSEALRTLESCAHLLREPADTARALEAIGALRARARVELRDRMAMVALPAAFAVHVTVEGAAEKAYVVADAMLAAREK